MSLSLSQQQLLAEFKKGSDHFWIYNESFYKTIEYRQTIDPIREFRYLLDNGYLRRATLYEILLHDMTLEKIKEECKKRGLKISGRKADLLKNLLANEPNAIIFRKTETFFFPTEKGMEELMDYEIKTEYIKDVKRSLALKYINDVSNGVLSDENGFTDTFVEDEENIRLDISRDNQQYIFELYKNKPKRLSDLDSQYLEKSRKILALDRLLGASERYNYKNISTNISGISLLQVMEIFQEFLFERNFLKTLGSSKYYTGVEIISTEDFPCLECQKLIKRYKKGETIPEIPNPKCLNVFPCHLRYTTYYEPKTPEEINIKMIVSAREDSNKSHQTAKKSAGCVLVIMPFLLLLTVICLSAF